MALIRDILYIGLSFDSYDSNGNLLSERKIIDLTKSFASADETEINIERDGFSGTMTSLSYSIKFNKHEEAILLKLGYEKFITKEDYSVYDSLIEFDNSSNIIQSNTLSELFSNFSEIKSIDNVKIIIGLSKDNSVVKPIFNYESELDSYNDFYKVYKFDVNWESYREDYNYIELDATDPSLQRYLKSKGDFVYDIPLSEFSDNELIDFHVDKSIDIPIYAKHTFPFYDGNQSNETEQGSKQMLYSTKDIQGIAHYLPTISWDGEITGLDSGILNDLTFGSQSGKEVISKLSDKQDSDYLLKNDRDYNVNIGKIKLECNVCIFEITLRNILSHNSYIRLIKVKNGEITSIISQKRIDTGTIDNYFVQISGRIAEGWINKPDYAERIEYVSRIYNNEVIHNTLIFVPTYFKVDITDINLEPTEEICLEIYFDNGTFYENILFSYMYFTKSKISGQVSDTMRTDLSLTKTANDDKAIKDYLGNVIIKGVYPENLVKKILNKWKSNFTLNYIRSGTLGSEIGGAYINYGVLSTFGTLPIEYIPKTIFVAGEVLNYKQNPSFHISLKEIIKWFNVSGYEYSIDGDIMTIAPREYFYNNRIDKIGENSSDNKNTINFDNNFNNINEQGVVSLSVNSSKAYTSIQLGYEKEDYDAIVGSYDPVSVFNYDTNYESDEEKTLELTTKIRMDFYGMIYLTIKNYSEDTDKTNEDTFAIDCIEKIDLLHGAPKQYLGFWDIIKSIANINQDGYQTDVTYYNALRVPDICAELMNKRLLRIFSDTFKFTSSDNYKGKDNVTSIINFDLNTTIDENILYQNIQNIDNPVNSNLIIKGVSPIYNMGLADINVGTIRQLWLLNNSNYSNQLLRFVDDDGIIRYGFINKLNFNVVNYKKRNIQLLLAKPNII